MANKENSLAHTKWMCKYHIVFTPKYRRKVIYNQYKQSIREILIRLCKYKGVEILEGHLMPDHIHMLVSIRPKISVSSFMGYLKGKSALMIFDKHANLKYKFGIGRNEVLDMAKALSCFRDSYLQHVFNGFHRNTGDPAGCSKDADRIKQADNSKDDSMIRRKSY